MTCLVIGGETLFFIGHDHGTAFSPHHHLILGFFKFSHGDSTAVLARGLQCSFIDKVGQISTGETRRATGNHPGVNIIGQRHLAHMYFENFLTPQHIRVRYDNLTVKTARTQQGRIKHIRTVGGSDQDDTFIGFKPVHLDQHLVERLFTFVITAAKTGTTMAADSINFVDKDDTWCVFLALFEHITDTAGTDTDKHFNKI